MKILCVCSQGNKRSVVTRFALNHKHDALACGVDVNFKETLAMLCKWSDVILLAEPEMRRSLPVKYHKKIDTRYTIGPDIYPPSIDKKLYRLIKKKLVDLN